jgi:hypothetical protein
MESALNIVESIERGQLPVAEFDPTTVAGEGEAVFQMTLMKVTMTLATKGGRTAGEAIRLEMAAETNGHEASQKTGYKLLAINC